LGGRNKLKLAMWGCCSSYCFLLKRLKILRKVEKINLNFKIMVKILFNDGGWHFTKILFHRFSLGEIIYAFFGQSSPKFWKVVEISGDKTEVWVENV